MAVRQGSPQAQRIPDALLIPESFKGPKGKGSIIDRVARVCDLAEPLLAVDRAKGERAYIRPPLFPGQKMFVTKSLDDTMLFPQGERHGGKPRYTWIKQDDGIELGYLVEG
jgi:hypothetical protein